MKVAPTDTTQNETDKGSSSDSGQGNGGETNKVPFIRSKDSKRESTIRDFPGESARTHAFATLSPNT